MFKKNFGVAFQDKYKVSVEDFLEKNSNVFTMGNKRNALVFTDK